MTFVPHLTAAATTAKRGDDLVFYIEQCVQVDN